MSIGEILGKAEKDLRQKFLPLFLEPEPPQVAQLLNHCEPVLIEIMDLLGETWLKSEFQPPTGAPVWIRQQYDEIQLTAGLLRDRACRALFSFPGGAYSRAIEYSLIGRIDNGRGGDDSLFGKYKPPDGCPFFLEYALRERSQYWEDLLSQKMTKPTRKRGRPRDDSRRAKIAEFLTTSPGWRGFKDDDLIALMERLDQTTASAPSGHASWAAYLKKWTLQPNRVIDTLSEYETMKLAANKITA